MRVVTVTLADWHDLVRVASSLEMFVFRGHASSDWILSSTLERAFKLFNPTTPPFIPPIERSMLVEFKAKFHLYGGREPEESNDFEWLAHMQHHGSPTRLVDFTRSVYIAAFFALSYATSTAAVWAVNQWLLLRHLENTGEVRASMTTAPSSKLIPSYVEYINECIGRYSWDNPTYNVVPLTPPKSFSRLARQDGLFLVQNTFGSIIDPLTFEDCLARTLGMTRQQFQALETIQPEDIQAIKVPEEHTALIKIVLPSEMHHQARRHLKLMGLTEETIFPDVDGLARSLIMKHLRSS